MAIRRVAALTGALTMLAIVEPRRPCDTEAATAAGTVFFPNPVQQLGLQDLADDKDCRSARCSLPPTGV